MAKDLHRRDIWRFDHVMRMALKMVNAAPCLEMPILATE